MNDESTRLDLEQLACQMVHGTAARTRKVVLTRIFLHQSDKVFKIPGIYSARIDHQDLWNAG